MSKDTTFYIGADIGNGTSIGYCDDGQVDDKSFVASMESAGDQVRNISMGTLGVGSAVGVPEDKIHLNGNRQTLMRERDGITKLYGLSCMNVPKVSYNAAGADRYKFTERLQGLFEKVIGGFTKIPFGPHNNLKVCLGMAPGLYTGDKYRDKIINQLHAAFDDYHFEDDQGRNFTVVDLAVTGEGFGVYYSHVTDLNAKNKIKPGRNKKGYLIVDAGRGTFDTMIIKKFILLQGSSVVSLEDLGTTHMFQSVANMYNARTGQKLSAFDVEIYNYVGFTLKEVDYNILKQCVEVQKRDYLDNVASYLQDTYSSLTDYFSKIIITGGITNIFEDNDDFADMISFGDKPVEIFDVYSNARGFYNVARVNLSKNGGVK